MQCGLGAPQFVRALQQPPIRVFIYSNLSQLLVTIALLVPSLEEEKDIVDHRPGCHEFVARRIEMQQNGVKDVEINMGHPVLSFVHQFRRWSIQASIEEVLPLRSGDCVGILGSHILILVCADGFLVANSEMFRSLEVFYGVLCFLQDCSRSQQSIAPTSYVLGTLKAGMIVCSKTLK